MTHKPIRSKLERIKESSQFLRGTILNELSCSTDKFSADDVSLLKFHGTYQQDDRDARKGRVPGVGKQHMYMVRLKIPGGCLMGGQMLGTLDMCDRFANGTLRLITRHGLQLYGVVKGNLWNTIHDINQSMLTTLGACGDIVRNVMCCPAPQRNDRVRSQMQSTASDLAKHFAPRTSAYFEIWVDGEKRLEQSLESNVEPIYGRAYLPRKFKIGVALPEDNCIDVYTQDIGLLAIVEAGQLVGYNMQGDQLNFIYKDMAPLDELMNELLPLLSYFKSDRQPGEAFGDFCHRKGLEILLRFHAERKTTAKLS